MARLRGTPLHSMTSRDFEKFEEQLEDVELHQYLNDHDYPEGDEECGE